MRGCLISPENLELKCWKFRTVLGSPVINLRTVIGPFVLYVC